MEKEKILQRYRQEGVDEGREEVNRRGDDAGFYAMCVLALLLMIYQAFTGQVFGDVAAMLFVFCSVGAFAGTGLTGTVRSGHGHFYRRSVPGMPGMVSVGHAVKKTGGAGKRRLLAYRFRTG